MRQCHRVPACRSKRAALSATMPATCAQCDFGSARRENPRVQGGRRTFCHHDLEYAVDPALSPQTVPDADEEVSMLAPRAGQQRRYPEAVVQTYACADGTIALRSLCGNICFSIAHERAPLQLRCVQCCRVKSSQSIVPSALQDTVLHSVQQHGDWQSHRQLTDRRTEELPLRDASAVPEEVCHSCQ